MRRAYIERQLGEADLPPGAYDAEAQARLDAAAPGVRAEALRREHIVRFMAVRRAAGLTRGHVHAAVRESFGARGNSPKSLDRWEAAVRGIDAVNWGPALIPAYKGATPSAEVSPEAWALFEARLKGAFKDHRIIAVYHEIAGLARKKGWAWPSYATVMRRFKALPEVEQLAIREGREAAHKRFYEATLRSTAGLLAMEWVVLDGRQVDVWVLWPDGIVLRPTVLGLVDQASGKGLDIEIARSESAEATAALERRAFARYGAPDNLLTDNGAAFSGGIHAGRVGHKFRNKGNRRRELEPPGIHALLGFRLHFAAPKNAQAKLMERKYADMAREIDTCPEFAGAHAGSRPGDRPEGAIVPVPLAYFELVYRAKLAAYNARAGRRSQGCLETGTTSYDAAFEVLSAGRIKRVLAPEQLRRAGFEWSLTTVMPDGRVRGKDGWVYGEDLVDGSQDKLLRLVGRKVWVGTNPLDRSEPAIVWNPATDRLVHNAVYAVERGRFDDAEGARRSARNRSHVRKLTKRLEQIDAKLARGIFDADYLAAAGDDDTLAESVVRPHFKGPIRPALDDETAGEVKPLRKGKAALSDEQRRNLDRFLGLPEAKRL